jgi:hypothetical protein
MSMKGFPIEQYTSVLIATSVRSRTEGFAYSRSVRWREKFGCAGNEQREVSHLQLLCNVH